MAAYEIWVKGHLDGHWSEWFDGLEITNLENGEAMLSGDIVDQAALHGVLIKVRDLSLPLLSVNLIDERCGAGVVAGRSDVRDVGQDSGCDEQHGEALGQ